MPRRKKQESNAMQQVLQSLTDKGWAIAIPANDKDSGVIMGSKRFVTNVLKTMPPDKVFDISTNLIATC